MKKKIVLILSVVAIIAVFTACSIESGKKEDSSTTAVTDSNGVTHYYEVVTDDKGEIHLESVTDKTQGESGKKNIADGTSSTAKIETAGDSVNSPDNEVPFVSFDSSETDVSTDKSSTEKFTQESTTLKETLSHKETQPATDKDGWITKWY